MFLGRGASPATTPQSYRWPSMRPKITASKPAVASPTPARSNRWRRPGTQVGDEKEGECEGDDADRNVHRENRAPSEVGYEEAAHGRPGDDGEAGKRPVDGEHAPALLRREQRDHERQALGGKDRSTETLRGAEHDELSWILRQAAERRRDCEYHDPGGEHVARAVDVA